MTLILTELNDKGIAMAADSAVTFSIAQQGVNDVHQVLHGARKLQLVHHIQGGISCWGMGRIQGLPTDMWLEQAIGRSRDVTDDVHTFSEFLAEELNQVLPRNSPTSGFHVAAYDEVEGIGRLPVFYHVHNGPSDHVDDIDPEIFNANLDRPAADFLPGQSYITRNGDFRLYAEFFGHLWAFVNGLVAKPEFHGVHIPSPDILYTHARFLRLQIQFVSGLYEVSNLVPGIGGPITILGIGPNGYEFFETR